MPIGQNAYDGQVMVFGQGLRDLVNTVAMLVEHDDVQVMMPLFSQGIQHLPEMMHVRIDAHHFALRPMMLRYRSPSGNRWAGFPAVAMDDQKWFQFSVIRVRCVL